MDSGFGEGDITDKIKTRRLAVVFFERMKEGSCSIIMAQAG